MDDWIIFPKSGQLNVHQYAGVCDWVAGPWIDGHGRGPATDSASVSCSAGQ